LQYQKEKERSFMRFGFSGSRSLSKNFTPLVASVLASLPEDAEVLVGNAKGLDELVRSLCPAAKVFYPAFPGRGGLAARSAALVKACDVLFVFVSSPCPEGVQPSRSFSGKGSGSWGSAALAAGLGKKLKVFWCADSKPVFPAWVGEIQNQINF
jgi:hypothetical protein